MDFDGQFVGDSLKIPLVINNGFNIDFGGTQFEELLELVVDTFVQVDENVRCAKSSSDDYSLNEDELEVLERESD
ncbi:hypothetical protein L1987_46907 [Smallanthus sonchifolius]|uniref:Uncharacterized protein n=2 Tax=Smallanthus sonchifolius TaxID=185202 RepID=A0ACB9G1L6_9ASTR|nr:hypothetical protein L1987_46905 [Smallanthus sonchifolius]KAI3777113.1 hypothetical protein L1987_46907 [Smallanthus sonchifolius]